MAAALVVGCTSGTEVLDAVGLWVQPSADDAGEAAGLELDVVFDRAGDVGCWSARAVDGDEVLPVHWPAGTLLGRDTVLELPGGLVVADGDLIRASGGLRVPVAGDAVPSDDPSLPAGCDLSSGWFVVDEVTDVGSSSTG